jgi:hypothetical protein
MVDCPPAIAAAGSDRRSQRILQGAAFSRRIDAGMRNRAGEISGKDRPIVSAHHRCSIHQETAQAAIHATAVPTPMISTSTKSLTCDVGLAIRGQATTSASRPANGRRWTGINQVMQAS